MTKLPVVKYSCKSDILAAACSNRFQRLLQLKTVNDKEASTVHLA